MFTFSKSTLNNLSTVDTRLIEIAHLALRLTKIDFGVPNFGGLRTCSQQNLLYVAGKSKCDGYEKKSRHQDGKALDVYAYVDGTASWEKEHLTHVAAAFLQAASTLGYKISWGGFWRYFEDYPHFQLEEK